MSFTREDYLAWRGNPVTQQLQTEMEDQIDLVIASLLMSAGEVPYKDSKLAGEVKGLKFLVEWVPTVEEPEEKETTDA